MQAVAGSCWNKPGLGEICLYNCFPLFLFHKDNSSPAEHLKKIEMQIKSPDHAASVSFTPATRDSSQQGEGLWNIPATVNVPRDDVSQLQRSSSVISPSFLLLCQSTCSAVSGCPKQQTNKQVNLPEEENTETY